MGGPFKPSVGLSGVFGADVQEDVFRPERSAVERSAVFFYASSSVQKYFLIAAGGALGSLARYLVGSAVAARTSTRFFYGTFVVNISACLLIGFVITLLGKHVELSNGWRYLIPIGFIGAYSTFSTFEWEMFTALETGAFLLCALYVSLSVLLGLVAVWLGALLARTLS